MTTYPKAFEYGTFRKTESSMGHEKMELRLVMRFSKHNPQEVRISHILHFDRINTVNIEMKSLNRWITHPSPHTRFFTNRK